MPKWISALTLLTVLGCGKPTVSPPPPSPVTPTAADMPAEIPAMQQKMSAGEPVVPEFQASELIQPGDLPPQAQPPKTVEAAKPQQAARELKHEAVNPVDQFGKVEPASGNPHGQGNE